MCACVLHRNAAAVFERGLHLVPARVICFEACLSITPNAHYMQQRAAAYSASCRRLNRADYIDTFETKPIQKESGKYAAVASAEATRVSTFDVYGLSAVLIFFNKREPPSTDCCCRTLSSWLPPHTAPNLLAHQQPCLCDLEQTFEGSPCQDKLRYE